MDDQTLTFTLPETMKMEDCEQLHSFLSAAQGHSVEIDCAAVTRLTGLAGQILAMGRKAWDATDNSFQLKQQSTGLQESAATLGLSDVLNLKEVDG